MKWVDRRMKKKYREIEDEVIKMNQKTLQREDLDQETKNKIILQRVAALDEVRNKFNIKE